VFVTLHSLHLPRQALPMVGPRPPNGRLVTVAAARSGSSRPFPALDQALHSLASSCRAPSMAGCSVRSATAQEVQLKRKRESLALPLRVTGSFTIVPAPSPHSHPRTPAKSLAQRITYCIRQYLGLSSAGPDPPNLDFNRGAAYWLTR